MKKSLVLRNLFKSPGAILAPGAYDALSAKIIEKVGFKVIQHTGYGTSASLLAKPDVGLVDFTEMCRQVKQIARSVYIPVIGDADTGYGNAINVYRTVQEYIWAGAAGLFIEDQIWPKRCGHMLGKQVISQEEMMGKLRAAIKARDEVDPDFMLCYRTDALAVHGLDDAIKRGKLAVDLGIDYIFIERIETIKQMHRIAKEIKAPLMLNLIEGGRTPIISLQEAEEIGFKYITYPLTTLYSATKAMYDVLKILKETGTTESYLDRLCDFEEFAGIVDLNAIKNMEKDFLPKKLFEEKYSNVNNTPIT
jgi:2,3-dimethylmalate lyase